MSVEVRTSPSVIPVHVGRRPIHDRGLHVVAYELRYQPNGSSEAEAADTFLAGMVDVGLDRLGSGHDVVVRLPEPMLRGPALAHLPHDRLVLALSPSQRVDDDLVTALRSAHRDGLRLRVADPVEVPAHLPLLELACMVAVDVAGLTPSRRRERRAALQAPGRAVVACGVDDDEVHADSRDAGYDLFSGQALSEPTVVAGRRVPSDATTLLRLLACLHDPDVSVDDIESGVAACPALAYQLLRYVNSAFVGLRSEVDSVRRAIVQVGPTVVGQLTGLLLAQATGTADREATRVALQRARMCELVGQTVGDARAVHHTVGLLSAMDLLTGVDLETALADLPLTEEVLDAILHQEGRLGRVLEAVRQYERFAWDDPVVASFDPVVLSDAWVRAVTDCEDLRVSLQPATAA